MTFIYINALWNKCDVFRNSVMKIIVKLMISETKLDETFPHALYDLKVFPNPYKLDKNSQGSEILVQERNISTSNLVKLAKKLKISWKLLKVSVLN